MWWSSSPWTAGGGGGDGGGGGGQNDNRSVRGNIRILVGRILIVIVVLNVHEVGAAPAGGGRSYSEAGRWSAADVTDDVTDAVRPGGGGH